MTVRNPEDAGNGVPDRPNDRQTDTSSDDVDVPEWCEEILERLEMVSWDRFTVGEEDDVGRFLSVYGWIDREADDYKDFVLLRFFPETSQNIVAFTTSSDRYSTEIHRLIYGEGRADEHNACRRVEHAFDVSNAIRLDEGSA